MTGLPGRLAAHLGPGVIGYAAALVLGVASATGTYLAHRGALHVARDFHLATARRAVLEAGRRTGAAAGPPMLSPAHGVRHLPTLDARHAATVLRLLLEAILPLVTSAVAVGTLLLIDPLITLSLAPLAVAGVASLALPAARGARLLRRDQERAAEMAPLVSETLAHVGVGDEHGDGWCAPSDPEGASAGLSGTLASLYDQTLLGRQVRLANRLLQIVSFVWLLLLFGRHLARGATAWSTILVYLLALRYAWQCLGRLSALAVEAARFLPSPQVCAAVLGPSSGTPEAG